MGNVTTMSNGKAGRKNAIGNFFVDRVNPKVMREFAKANGVELDADASPEQAAVALSVHLRGATSRGDMIQCERCHGEAPESLPACPFCGLVGETIEDAVSDDGGEEEAAAPPSADDVGTDSDEDRAEVAEETAEEAPVLVKAKAPKAKKAREPKPATTAMVRAKKNGAAVQADHPATVADLDRSIARVVELKTAQWSNFLELGAELSRINKAELWKLRKGDDGKQRYASWDAFITIELKFTPNWSYKIMSAAEAFSQDDLALLGRSRAIFIAKAAPEDRAELKRQVLDKELSKRETEKLVREKIQETGRRGGDEQKSKAGKASAATRAERQDKVTIASIEGRKTVKLYAKPPSLRGVKLSDCKRAKTINDEPIGMLELAGDVVMLISVVKKEGQGLALVVDTRRVSHAVDEE